MTAVDRYLDQLAIELRGRAPDIRRVLAEVEGHLEDAVADAVAAGADRADAERQAVARMGPARTVARRFSARPSPSEVAALVRHLLATLALLAGVGFAAVGASGVLAAGMGAAFGHEFVSGDSFGVTYTAGRCAQLRELKPAAATCAEAATEHHYDEVVGQRLDVGVAGLVLVVAAVLARRRWRSDELLLPDGFAATIAVAMFGAAAAFLLLESVGYAVIGGATEGVGSILSGGLVAAVMATAYLVPLARTLLLRAQAAGS